MLEVIALNVDDARKAEEGGAHQLELVGTMDKDGLSPSPALAADVVTAVNIPVRPMLRLSDGFATNANEVEQLKQLAVQYADAGAAGVVLGFLTPDSQIDIAVLEDILSSTAPGMDYTFHRAIDYAAQGAWETLLALEHPPRHVLTAGSPLGVGEGIETLVARAKATPELILAGGGLKAEFVPRFTAAGIRNFHIGSAARLNGSFDERIDPKAVARWVELTEKPRLFD